MTVEQAKEMHDGATISLRGNLIDGSGGDKFKFRDKTGTIDTIIPQAVFDGRKVQPDNMISINGSLDKKSSPPVVASTAFRNSHKFHLSFPWIFPDIHEKPALYILHA